MTAIKGDLLSVRHKPRVNVPQVPLPLRLLGDQLSKLGRDQLQQQGRHGDHHEQDGRAREYVSVARLGETGDRQPRQQYVEHGLGDLPVKVRHGVGHGFDVVGQTLGAVVEPAVQNGDAVVALVLEVEAVTVVDEAGAEAQGDTAF